MPIASRCLLVLCLAAASAGAEAASFSERFRDFIVGAEAQAHSRAPELDASARSCLQCHDGSHATPVAVRPTGSPLQIRGSQTVNHPVGMMYEQAVMRDPRGYKSRAALNPGIRLVDGQVSCVSCHQTRANTVEVAANTCSATRELTVGHRDRDLCLACHDK